MERVCNFAIWYRAAPDVEADAQILQSVSLPKCSGDHTRTDNGQLVAMRVKGQGYGDEVLNALVAPQGAQQKDPGTSIRWNPRRRPPEECRDPVRIWGMRDLDYLLAKLRSKIFDVNLTMDEDARRLPEQLVERPTGRPISVALLPRVVMDHVGRDHPRGDGKQEIFERPASPEKQDDTPFSTGRQKKSYWNDYATQGMR